MRLLFALSLVWSASAQLKLVSKTKGCDYNSPAEVYLKDESAEMPTLKACQESCVYSPACVSITYYFDKFCSHFASTCENLRSQRRGAQTFSKGIITAAPTTITAAPTTTTTTASTSVTTGTMGCVVKPDDGPTFLDIAFVVDMTGSMGGVRDAVVSQITAIETRLSAKGLVMRVAFIAYRDQHNHAAIMPHFEILDFTEDIPEFEAFVNDLSAEGGGNIREDVAGGLEKAKLLDWKHPTRVLILIADNPGHRAHNKNAIAQLRALRTEKKITSMNFLKIQDSTNGMIKTFNKNLVGFDIEINTMPVASRSGDVDPAIFADIVTQSAVSAMMPGFIEGLVFGDKNKNGKLDVGEPLREGVAVKVSTSECKAHLKTDSSGRFKLEVPPGDATIQIEGSSGFQVVNMPSGRTLILPDVGLLPVERRHLRG